MASEARGDSRGHPAAALDLGSGRIHIRCGRGAGVGTDPHGRAVTRARRAHPLVQPLRSAVSVAGHYTSSRGRGLLLLPTLPHGTVARGWLAEASSVALPRVDSRVWHMS